MVLEAHDLDQHERYFIRGSIFTRRLPCSSKEIGGRLLERSVIEAEADLEERMMVDSHYRTTCPATRFCTVISNL